MTNSELLEIHVSAVKRIAQFKLSNIHPKVECLFRHDGIIVDITVFDAESDNVSFTFYPFQDRQLAHAKLSEVLNVIALDDFAKAKECWKEQNAAYLPSDVGAA